jgi:hypothetical protein
MYIIPKSGLTVRDPKTKRALPAAGKEITTNIMYWMRRVRDGDVKISKAPAAPTPVPVVAPKVRPTPTHLIGPGE